MTNPCYVTNRVIKEGFDYNLDRNHINQGNFKLTITPNFLKVYKILVKNVAEELSEIYAKVMNHYEINYQVLFSERFDRQDMVVQVLHEIFLIYWFEY